MCNTITDVFHSKRLIGALLLCLTLVTSWSASAAAQSFTAILDPSNPIVTDVTPAHYTGASWIDYDVDGDLDLFVVVPGSNDLYRNDGTGVFTKITTGVLVTDPAAGRGVSWGDYDNDGDPDCFVSGSPSVLYNNDGSGNFTKVTTGEIATEDNRGWSCAWSDFDNDRDLDLVISFPNGFVAGGSSSNQMFRNDGPPNYNFTKITTGAIVTGLAPYTNGSWFDFDDDGDQDFFMGSGPASTIPKPDFLYRNLLKETGTSNFERITDSPIGTDLVDGQVWNWVDYDNDGDLDGFLTNWGGAQFSSRPNKLYRNDGGTFVSITTGAIVTDHDVSLSSVWGDYDNDGDLDCFVANDAAGNSNRYYENNGDGTFTSSTTGDIFVESTINSGASAGDYDNDGDLDLFVAGFNAGNRRLFRNDLAAGSNWLKLRLTSAISNRSAIGAKVRAFAAINASPTWQRRSLTTGNTFMGQNSLEIHFGFGDAALIDSIIIDWPSGQADTMTAVPTNQTLTVSESGVGLTADTRFGLAPTDITFTGLTSETVNSWLWDFDDGSTSTEISPTHSYTNGGVFSPSVTVQTTNGQFSSTAVGLIGVAADTLRAVDIEGSAGTQVMMEIYARNFLPLSRIEFAISWSGPLGISVSTPSVSGLRSSSLAVSTDGFNPIAKQASYSMNAPTGDFLSPGSGPILRFPITIPIGGAITNTAVFTIESNALGPLRFISSFGSFTQSTGAGIISRGCCNIPGDADNSGGFNIADVTFGVARIFTGGPASACQDEADADGNNSFNIADVTFGIARIFGGGPPPVCGTTGG